MRGLLRPCRHALTAELRQRWLSHLCGSCLALRDTSGQAARALTGYDLLLVPVLVEAQAGRLPTVQAGPCVLRGMRGAEVVDPAQPAALLGAATALAAGAAGLADKLTDGDVTGVLRRPAAAAHRRLALDAEVTAARVGADVGPLHDAVARAAEVEHRPDATLGELLAPAGEAVAAMFVQTAVGSNGPALRRLGDAFGRLVHLLDAVDDRDDDLAAGRFNPLEATGTDAATASALAGELRDEVQAALGELELVDGALLGALLGAVLDAAVQRRQAPEPSDRRSVLAPVLVAAASTAAMWGGGGRRRRGPFGGGGYYDPYGGGYGGGYGYRPRRRRGMSCCDMLACDCCATEACNGCCGGDGDCCVCCV